MADDRPLETGWLHDTPVGDTVLRRFLHAQADVNDAMAAASGGRTHRDGSLALADTGGPVAYFNQGLLLRPLDGPDDPALGETESFFAAGPPRTATLLSAWPTPDLGARGWTRVGHPAFVLRTPSPHTHVPDVGVEVRAVTTTGDLHEAERVAIEGYPIDEAAGRPAGSVLPEGLLASDVRYRLGLLDSRPVAAAASLVAHGVANLCFAATLPAARRRGVWEALVWARVADAPGLPAVAYTSDHSRPGFERMGFVPVLRFTLWARTAGG